MTSYLVRILVTLAIFSVKKCEESECQRKLKEVKIIPTYAYKGSPENLEVEYEDKYFVNCGNELPVIATINSPIVTYDVKGNCGRITLLMFDPDSVGLRQFRHWLVINIPAGILKNGYDNEGGQVVDNYFPPGFQFGHHRYIFCIYCQKEYISEVPPRTILRRNEVNPRKLADKYGLGNPVACNFFYSSLIDPKYQNAPVIKILSDATKQL